MSVSSRKSFVYLIRRDGPAPRLLVFGRLDEPGLEVPKGAVEEGESFEEAALRELREEAGIETARVIRELGVTRYGGEEQRFLLAAVRDVWPETFAHVVTGNGIDAGLRYRFRWEAIGVSLEKRLVQGCGAFVEALIRAVGRP